MKPNRLPVCAPLLSDGLCRSGFTKPRGMGLLDTQTHTQIDTHAHTHKTGKGGRSRNNKVQTGQTQGSDPRCQWADRTGRRFHAHAMTYLSALILCSDSITCRSLILYSPTTHTHTPSLPSWQFKTHGAHSPEHSRPGELFQDRASTPPTLPGPECTDTQTDTHQLQSQTNSPELDRWQLVLQMSQSLTPPVTFLWIPLFNALNFFHIFNLHMDLRPVN